MDKLANQLRQDADNIEIEVSADLDDRITASLRNVTPHELPAAAAASRHPALFWWASSLTGIAAAAAVILIVNTKQAEVPVTATPAAIVAAVPIIDWKTETAMLTGPLEDELHALRSDIERAEKKVKEDIGL